MSGKLKHFHEFQWRAVSFSADSFLPACCLLTGSFYLILCTCFIYEMQKLQFYAKNKEAVLSFTEYMRFLISVFVRIKIFRIEIQ